MSVAEETIKPAIEFVKQIKPENKVAIIHGHDNDSICSAVVMHKLIEKLVKIRSSLVISELNFSFGEITIKKLKKLKPSHIIIVDIAKIGIDILTELTKMAKVMIVDHHTPKGYVRVVYINPRIYNREIYLPTTYLVYKIYETFLDVKDIMWIAGIGVLADNGIKFCVDLANKIKSLYPELVNNVKLIDEELFESSLLGELTKIFDSASIVSGAKGSSLAVNVMLESKNYRDILEGKSKDSKKLLEWREKTKVEFDRLLDDFKKNRKEFYKNIVVYEIKSRFRFKSSLSSYLSKLFDDKILVIYQKDGNYLEISFRRGSKVDTDLALLASEIVRNIPNSSGGGHPQASGARIPAKYLSVFFENMKNMV